MKYFQSKELLKIDLFVSQEDMLGVKFEFLFPAGPMRMEELKPYKILLLPKFLCPL